MHRKKWRYKLKENQSNTVEAPHSPESEMMVLGCMFSKGHDLKVASESLQPQDFYIAPHQTIFKALKKLYRSDTPADTHLIAEQLKATNQLEEIGGVQYLVKLTQFAGTSAYIEEYVKILRERSLARQLFFASQDIQKKASEPSCNINSLLTQASITIENLENNYSYDFTPSISEIILGLEAPDEGNYLEKISRRKDYYSKYKKPFPIGIPTDYPLLDSEDFILRPSSLVIVAGRPAMGKTAFGLNLMLKICSQKRGVGFISLEMSCSQILERLVSLEIGIPAYKISSGNISKEEFESLNSKLPLLSEKNIYIADKGVSNINQLSAKARTLRDKKKIEILFVDYLQLLGASQKKDQRHYEVAEVSSSLKKLAMELNIPIVCLAQASRKADERPRPVLSDLKDSGQIEQDADVVCFLHRPGYYNSKEFDPRETEIIIAKNRHGKTFTQRFNFNLELGLFTERQETYEAF